MSLINQDIFAEIVSKQIKEDVEKIVAEEAEAASERVNKRVRLKIGSIATLITRNVSFSCEGQSIKITIGIKDLD